MFRDCYDLNLEFTLPDTVLSIGAGAFWECSALVHVPDSVTSIDNKALMNFTISEGNLYYSSNGGMLLTKDGKTLLQGRLDTKWSRNDR